MMQALDYFSSLVKQDDAIPLFEAALCIAQDDDPALDLTACAIEIDKFAARLNQRLPKDIAQKVIDVTGSKSQIDFKKHSEVFGENFEEPARRVPDISKISKAIGWKPKKSLESIILEVAEYTKANEV
jgi:nucleoside-diphosphate-sugar epimerase